MNETFFSIMNIQKRMDSINILKLLIKVVGALIVFLIFFYSLVSNKDMINDWIFSLLILVLFFGVEVILIKKHKNFEFELYRLEKQDLQRQRELAQINGETLPDEAENHEVEMPSDKVKYPIAYYVILFILDVLIGIFLVLK